MKRFFSILLILSTIFIGCKGKEKLKAGDMVFAQWIEGEGGTWEEAKVVKVEGEQVTIAWKDTFAKGGETETTKHISKVIKMKKLKEKDIKEGMNVMIQPPDYSSWVYFKGKVVGIKDDGYEVKFKVDDNYKTETVSIDALWAGY